MGRVDVDQLIDELTPRQFAEWQAYWQLEPWDVRIAAAAICSTIHNAVGILTRCVLKIDWNTKRDGSTVSSYLLGYRLPRKLRRTTVTVSQFFRGKK